MIGSRYITLSLYSLTQCHHSSSLCRYHTENAYNSAQVIPMCLWTGPQAVTTLGVNRPGGGCTGCMGVNIAWTPQWFRERGGFWSYAPHPPTPAPPPPLQGAKCLRGVRVKDRTWAPPLVSMLCQTSSSSVAPVMSAKPSQWSSAAHVAPHGIAGVAVALLPIIAISTPGIASLVLVTSAPWVPVPAIAVPSLKL